MDKLEEGCYYHIYNRGVGKADIFWSKKDYAKLLEKYFYYLFISVNTYSYCLLKNHFHFLIRVRTISEQERMFESVKENYSTGSFYGDNYSEFNPLSVSTQFRHLFNSYTRFINTKLGRSGTLFEGTFKRIRINDEDHFNHMVCYIHRNPIHHRITKNYREYPYSSYKYFVSDIDDDTFLDQHKVLSNFGGIRNFIEAHDEFKRMLGNDFYLE